MNIFLLFSKAAGCDPQLLKRCPQGEQLMYGCMGGLIIMLSLLSGIIVSYAIIPTGAKLFQQLGTMAIGVCWWLMNYNLLRMIVITSAISDGSRSSILELFSNLAIGIMMTALLGGSFGTAVSVALLHDTVRTELSHSQQFSLEKHNRQVDSDYSEKLEPLYILKAEVVASQLKKSATSGLGKTRLKAHLASIDAQITQLWDEAKQKKRHYEDRQRNQHSFFTDVDKAFSLHADLVLLVMLFSLLIHLAPLTAKTFIFFKGPYEYLVEFQNKIVLTKYHIATEVGKFKYKGEVYSEDRFLMPEKLLQQEMDARSSYDEALVQMDRQDFLRAATLFEKADRWIPGFRDAAKLAARATSFIPPTSTQLRELVQQSVAKGIPLAWLHSVDEGYTEAVKVLNVKVIWHRRFDPKYEFWPYRLDLVGSCKLVQPRQGEHEVQFQAVVDYGIFRDDVGHWRTTFQQFKSSK
ncbi:MAG: DUF4407 domain-containing protein [Mariprofundus sp.]|nr:DUF4407 domain-containing protein [Mariprofundus sp.]